MSKIIAALVAGTFLVASPDGRPADEGHSMREAFDSLLSEHQHQRRSLRSWMVPAEILAEGHGATLLPLVRSTIMTESPLFSRRLPLALMTAAQLGAEHEEAVELLKTAAMHPNYPNALTALTYLPSEIARPVIHEIAPEFFQVRRAGPMVRLLAAMGDQRTLELMAQWTEDERLDPKVKIALLHAAERIEQRLAMPEPQRSERAREELIFWQTLHDWPNLRDLNGNYARQAEWLDEAGIRLSLEFLLERLDEPRSVIGIALPNPRGLAVAILGQQREEAAIPVLKERAMQEGRRGGLAHQALRQIGTEEALRALESLPER